MHNKTQSVYLCSTKICWAAPDTILDGQKDSHGNEKKRSKQYFCTAQCLQSQLWAHMMLEHLQRCTVCDPAESNWMKKNPTYTGLFHENALGCAYMLTLPQLCTCRKECNKYDLTAAQCFWLAQHIMIGPGGLLLVVPTYLLSQFQFYRWGCKRVHRVNWPVIVHFKTQRNFVIWADLARLPLGSKDEL